jgi:hypothetical protein
MMPAENDDTCNGYQPIIQTGQGTDISVPGYTDPYRESETPAESFTENLWIFCGRNFPPLKTYH